MSVERDIGTLQAEVKTLREDTTEIKKDVKSLLEFKWKSLGALVVISAIFSSAVSLAVEILRH